MGIPHEAETAEEDILRASFYELIAGLLAAPPSERMLERLRRLEGDGDTTPLGAALAELARVAARTTPENALVEFNDLFIGVTRGELVPYGSFYIAGSLNAKPLADLRADLARLGMARREGVAEPEDSMASLCEAMRAQIEGAFGPAVSLAHQHRFFNAHLAPWADRFFSDLEQARAARFYRPVGTLGRIFFEIEAQGLALTTSDTGMN